MRIVSLALVALALGLTACSDEEATPVELTPGAGVTSTTALPPGATPHAIGDNPQARFHAEEQCRNDPEQEEGVIRILDPATDAVLGEVVVDCDEVRERDAGTGPTTDEGPTG